ncbi:hypothetical protein [Streptomyces violascens]|uniref:hypothetical protein n=1 Tax=Streptomyces violascens TaxID=67381 RepID=UPI0036A40E65
MAGWQRISRVWATAALADRRIDHILAIDPEPQLGSEPGSRRPHPDLQTIEHQNSLRMR